MVLTCIDQLIGAGMEVASMAGGHINVTNSTCKRSSTSCEAGSISSNNASLSYNKIDDLDQIVAMLNSRQCV